MGFPQDFRDRLPTPPDGAGEKSGAVHKHGSLKPDRVLELASVRETLAESTCHDALRNYHHLVGQLAAKEACRQTLVYSSHSLIQRAVEAMDRAQALIDPDVSPQALVDYFASNLDAFNPLASQHVVPPAKR